MDALRSAAYHHANVRDADVVVLNAALALHTV
jgi:hypothetical protein